MKDKYTIEQDGFVGYWHPAEGHDGKALLVFPGSGADYELTIHLKQSAIDHLMILL